MLKNELDLVGNKTEVATKKLKELNLNEKKIDEQIQESNKKADEFSSKVIVLLMQKISLILLSLNFFLI